MKKTHVSKVSEALKYIDTLPREARERYLHKISQIDGRDPYQIGKEEWNSSLEKLPRTDYGDIVNYLVLGQSAYTLDEFKNFKSLNAYKQFVAGWISDVMSFSASNGKIVVSAKVRHSQRMNDALLKPWIILQDSGAVESAHCTCMAGLGESCSHVAAVLFWIDYVVRSRDKKTVTDDKAYWKPPAVVKVPYQQVTDINLQSAKSKKKAAEAVLQGVTPPANKFKPTVPIGISQSSPTQQMINDYAAKVYQAGLRPVFLSTFSEYADEFTAPKIINSVPLSLRSYRDPTTDRLNFADLLQHCQDKVLPLVTVSEQQADYCETESRSQSDSKLWFALRAGRITASKFHDAIHTNHASPALSLVKCICYPEESKFTSVQTIWGLEQELKAQEKYIALHENVHQNFQFRSNGLMLNPKYPFLGASPDGIVTCDCHAERGCIEIKCPYKHAASASIHQACGDKEFCLSVNMQTQEPTLKRNHRFYSQIQCQLFITCLDFCDFVVYLPSAIHVERILPDIDFWNENYPKAAKVFQTAILPEIVAKFFTNRAAKQVEEKGAYEPLSSKMSKQSTKFAIACPLSPSTTGNELQDDKGDETNRYWCYCKKNIASDMIGCDSENCPIQWFHFACLHISKAPKGKWFCPDCRKSKQSASGNSKKCAARH